MIGAACSTRVLLESGNDVLPVSVLLQRRDVGLDLKHEQLSLLFVHYVNDFLDHIVGVLVFHHSEQVRSFPGISIKNENDRRRTYTNLSGFFDPRISSMMRLR